MAPSPHLCVNGHENPEEARYCVVCGEVLNPAPNAVAGDRATRSGRPAGWRPIVWPSRRLLAVLGTIAATFVIVVGASFLLLMAPTPDLTGMAPLAATAELEAAGFEAGTRTEEFSASVPQGDVAGQSPGAGQRARKGGPVGLVISRGPAVQIPDLEGDRVDEAIRDLTGLALTADRQLQASESVPEGVVMAQQPAAGESVEEGSQVRLVVSSGPPRTTLVVEVDLSDLSLGADWSECSVVVTLFTITYPDAIVENESGDRLSSLDGQWTEDAGNGSFYPCLVVAGFSDTPTSEDAYRVVLDPTKPVGNSGDLVSRSQLEANDWVVEYG